MVHLAADKVIESALETLHALLGSASCADADGRHLLAEPCKELEGIEAISIRQEPVDQQEVDLAPLREAPEPEKASDNNGTVPCVIEGGDQRLSPFGPCIQHHHAHGFSRLSSTAKESDWGGRNMRGS
jgi:hypothetical protein